MSCFVFSKCENKIDDLNWAHFLCVHSILHLFGLVSLVTSLASVFMLKRRQTFTLNLKTFSLHSSLHQCCPSGLEWYNRIPLDTLPIKNYPNLLTVTVFISVTPLFVCPTLTFFLALWPHLLSWTEDLQHLICKKLCS